jgi:hypothetical protein
MWVFLDRRTFLSAVGTKHATIPRFWPEHFTARITGIKIPTRILRHDLLLLMLAMRTGYNRCDVDLHV